MKYSEWNLLDSEERKNVNWHRRPHIRTATIFTITFAVAFIIVVLGISKNSVVHLNRKPGKNEAFSIAVLFVKDKLEQPEKAVFPKSDFQSNIDTTKNIYHIQSSVKLENNSGQLVRSNWEVDMRYIGGDWAEKSNWQVQAVSIKP